jgi:DNA-binding LacI/PurR family transcriptional regulator
MSQSVRRTPMSGVPFRPKSAKAQIAEHVRDMIARGELREGDKLPSTRELAAAWQTHAATVQAALTPLVREGLLSRTRRRGTFVEHREARLERVGLYLSTDVWCEPTGGFAQAVCAEMDRLMKSRDGVVDVWVDPRPEQEKRAPWHDLVDAARRRKIQAVVSPRTDAATLAWLRALSVPTAFLAGEEMENGICFDQRQFVRDALGELARQGRRAAALITVLRRGARNPDGTPHPEALFHEEFRAAAREMGMTVRAEWIRSPAVRGLPTAEVERFGYESFKAIWRGRRHPDGLVVFTDIAARGVLVAASQRQVHVPDELSLVLHRNAELGLFCPYPAAYMDVRVTPVAERLLDILDRQFRGESAPPGVMKYEMVHMTMPRLAGSAK